ncbi:hypothetical protein WJX75_006796 [Coccomyxa subellipsoidea]|uniref:Nucleolar 27S pre-rRNA processing Urb2/Npa2 C-terminal domain-containing protein n=1 Tax=Coccomyxa subellipsoidea TaxID=248742 RepID=A0ABR2Z149_9CHLO
MTIDLETTPQRVRRHYMKMLLDWTVSNLLKSASVQQGSGIGSAPAQGSGAEATTGSAAPDNNPTRVAARLWALLAALLRMHEVGPRAAANPALVSAAAHACRSAAQDALRTLGADISADLADALLDALRLLFAKDRLHFSPSLEHSVAFAEAAVEAHAATKRAAPGASAAKQEPWTEVCAQSLAMLRSVCLPHPNQRKVYVSVVERLLIPLMTSCWGPDAAPGGSESSYSQRRLVMASRQLLDAVIFHRANVEGLAAIASTQMGSKGPESAKEVQDVEQGSDEEAPGGDKGPSQAPTYLSLLFKELSQEVREADAEKLSALLADFDFFALLLEPVLAGLESAAKESQLEAKEEQQSGPSGQNTKKRAPPEQGKRAAKKRKLLDGTPEKLKSGESAWPVLAEGAGMLVGTLKSAGVYRATEDVTGSHERLLGQLGTAVLLPFEALRASEKSSPSNKRTSVSDGLVHKAVAATGVLGAIMDVEHRALHARLESMWEVLWTAASQTTHAGLAEVKNAAEVAGRLVRAYGELRQVELLLHSLTAALSATTHTAAASRVIDNDAFKAALHQTIYEAPPGQKPKIVAFAAAGVEKLLAADGAPTLSVLLRGCLAGLRIDLTTSAAVAAALDLLISRSLATPLTDQLRRVAEAGGAHVDRPRLAALLQLYMLAIGAYAACAALQPQIAALPGQAIVLAVHAGQPAAAASPVLGYFDALCIASGSGKQHCKPPLPALLSLAQAVSSGGEGEPLQEALAARATYSRVEGFLEGLAAQMIARDSNRGSVSVKPEAALEIQTLAASLVASMATAPSYSKRRAASSIVAGPAGHATNVLETAELWGVLESLEALCIRGLEAASERVSAEPALVCHMPRHLRLASRILLAPWHLQEQDGGSAEEFAASTLPVQVALDVVTYLRAAARALPAAQKALPDDITARMLALHIHLLHHLLPQPVVPGPKRRLNMGLLMSIPTLAENGSMNGGPSSQAQSMLREALLLSVREVVHASSLADQELLYQSVHDLLLDQSRAMDLALPVLEVLLVAIKSVHSPAGLRVLSQSSEDLAAAILSCVQSAPTASDAAAAGVCMALRCLESLVARDTAIELPGYVVSQVLQLPALLFPPTAAAHAKLSRSPSRAAGIFAGCCHLLVAAVRHRTTGVRRCMALAAAAARGLLTHLLSWRSAGSADLAKQCAADLASVYEAVAERKDVLGMYCHHLLADYITLAAAPATPHGASEDDWTDGRPGPGPSALAALRPGACALFGACTAAQVQHVFAVLHKTGGGTRRTAMTELRQDYESNLKFSGKV